MNKDFKAIIDSLKESKQETLNRDSRVLLIDSLNTFLRSFVVINHMNPQGNHIGGLTGFLKSVGFAIRHIKPTRVIFFSTDMEDLQTRDISILNTKLIERSIRYQIGRGLKHNKTNQML